MKRISEQSRLTSFDVAVIGGGPGGIAAATICSEWGSHVVLVDQGLAPGGQIWRGVAPGRDSGEAGEWLKRLSVCGAAILSGSAVVDARAGDGDTVPHRLLVADMEGNARVLAAKVVILATGARELFLPFPGWTLPGVMGAGGAQALLKSGASFKGKSIVVSGSGPLLLPVAQSLLNAGGRVIQVLEQCSWDQLAAAGFGLLRDPVKALEAARLFYSVGKLYRHSSWVTRAEGDGGLARVSAVVRGTAVRIDCDILCTSYGLLPATELATVLGCQLSAGSVHTDPRQRTTVPGVFAVGEVTGVSGGAGALVEGSIAAHTALGMPVSRGLMRAAASNARWRALIERGFRLRAEVLALPLPDTVICRCEDVTLSELCYSGWRENKLLTRAGMGACQGRICGGVLGKLRGWEVSRVRPPLFPVPSAAMCEWSEVK